MSELPRRDDLPNPAIAASTSSAGASLELAPGTRNATLTYDWLMSARSVEYRSLSGAGAGNSGVSTLALCFVSTGAAGGFRAAAGAAIVPFPVAVALALGASSALTPNAPNSF